MYKEIDMESIITIRKFQRRTSFENNFVVENHVLQMMSKTV